jgi:hypothetical protein
MWGRLRQIRDAFNWGLFAYRLVVVLGLTGVASAIGGAVWAVIIGVPVPIALMAGSRTVVGAVYLAMAPLAYRALAQSPANRSSPHFEKIKPDYKVWSHVKILGLQEAAFLWCDSDPNSEIRTPDIEMWLTVFKDAIKARELGVAFSELDDSVDRKYAALSPSDDTKVSRESLKQFARSKNYDPVFLRDH